MSYDCNWCERRFDSVGTQRQHKYDENHFDYQCDRCYETYETEELHEEHEIEDHHYCFDCERQFLNRHSIQQHLRSAAHMGSSITCPFCKRAFTAAAGLVHHIESNACSKAKSLDRDTVFQIVREKDPSGVISKKLIDWTASDLYQATEKAWNPEKGAYECYLCNRTFSKLHSLNQHLNSPARAFFSPL